MTEETRSVVKRYIDAWDGKELSLSRDWVEKTITTLPSSSKVAAKLVLLTVIAPYQINDLNQDFRAFYE